MRAETPAPKETGATERIRVEATRTCTRVERDERARSLAAQLRDPTHVDDPRGAVIAMLTDALIATDDSAWRDAARQASEPSVEPFEGRTLSAQEVERLLDRPTIGAVRRWRDDAPKGRPYGMAALEGEADLVAHAGEGVRNQTLNGSAWTLGRLVADGLLTVGEIEAALVDAARTAGLLEREARWTVRGALKRRGVA